MGQSQALQLTDPGGLGLRLYEGLDFLGLTRETREGVRGVQFLNTLVLSDARAPRYCVFTVDMLRTPVGRGELRGALSDRNTLGILSQMAGRPVHAVEELTIGGFAVGFSLVVELSPPTEARLPDCAPFSMATRPAGDYLVPLGIGPRGDMWESLGRLGHVLIAGATGTGKSSILKLWLYALHASERRETLRVVLVDAKRVTFAPWSGSPLLMFPVATDIESATRAAMAVEEEADRRLSAFVRAGVESLDEFNSLGRGDRLPRILFVVDELKDLAMTERRRTSFYSALIRGASKFRAAGVTFVIGTTDPRADTVEPALRTNLQTRICGHVADWGASQAILDSRAAAGLPMPSDLPGRMLARLPGRRGLTEFQAYHVDRGRMREMMAGVLGLSGAPAVDEPMRLSQAERLVLGTVRDDLDGLFSVRRVYELVRGRVGWDEVSAISKRWEARGWLEERGGGRVLSGELARGG